MKFKKETKITSDFSEFIISLASPESILERSRGEITQPETINYRTYKPDMKGLFCERIFGPMKDWECHCGKYKRIRYRGIICDKCGVEVTEKKVRRDRMGHIALVVPIVHIWYFRSLPNKIGYLLGISTKKLDQIIYYERYIVIQPGIKEEEGINAMDFLNEEEYGDIIESLPDNHLLDDNDPNKFIAKMGGEALLMLLQRIDLDTLADDLRIQIANETSQQRKADALKRLKVIEFFREANTRIENKPEWMILSMLPVIPPDLRPLVALDGGRFATADLNDLYRRVIIRNNRLKRLIEAKAPEVILRNEKRMLQEAVDSLFDNSRKVNTVLSEGSRPLKSLSDLLKGKQGRFRQNLLGKRVDYSGRSVIVVGPELRLHECGIPKDMAAELFKPFIISKLIARGIVKTVKSAKKLIDQKYPVIWDILENVLLGHPVLLNRAPTLHKLGIQAFQPKLIEGKAIQLHPLVCSAYNADFDGDQMAVHVPLSQESIAEATLLMLASHNILNPTNGTPIVLPSREIILGLYHLTKGRKSTKEYPVQGEGKCFYAPEEVIIAINNQKLSHNAHIKVRIASIDKNGETNTKVIDTVAGRVVFNQYIPEEIGFINELLTKKQLQEVTAEVYRKTNTARTANFLDDIKTLGFQTSYENGLTIALEDVKIPTIKQELIAKAKVEVESIWDSYRMGLITDNERYNQVIDIWTRTNTELTTVLMNDLEQDQQGFNSIYIMMHSGARGSREQVRQLCGMRGLMAKPQKSLRGSVGEVIENPILSNFKEGLDILEYFISTHGARKGLADTALKTADAGYLTRRLVDVAQDVIVTEQDCGTLRGLIISNLKDNDEIIEPLSERVLGRITINDIEDPITDELLAASGEEITLDIAQKIHQTGLDEIEIRSVLTCEAQQGICAQCYGVNPGTGKIAQQGEAVGVIAAQSIGEPGTQLTLRTFHVGGTASNIAIDSSITSKFDGNIIFEDIKTIETVDEQDEIIFVVIGRSGEIKIIDTATEKILISYHIPYGAHLQVQAGEKISKGQKICSWDPYNAVIVSTIAGQVSFESIEENITYKEEYDEQTGHIDNVIIESKDKTKNPSIVIHGTSQTATYNIPVGAHLIVNNNTQVYAGQILVKIPRMMTKSSDITGGLPRITELFEVRNPSNPAIVSAIDGTVTYGEIKRGNREIFIESKEGIKKKYAVSLSKHILVQDQDYVKAGYPLTDGAITPADILAVKGPTAVQAYLVNEIQDVYRLQGVKINDKHIEIIVRQMMQKIEVIDSGDTHLLIGQVVNKNDFRDANDKILDKKIVIDIGDSTSLRVGQLITISRLREENNSLQQQHRTQVQVRNIMPAIGMPKLQGITQASLGTESLLSAASFQETTKVLSNASIRGKIDHLQGLKENVIVGHLIPAGTGIKKYRSIIVGSKEEYRQLLSKK